MNSADIIYLNIILDSYEGVGMMRTANEDCGEVTVYSSASQAAYLKGLFQALNEEGIRIDVIDTDYIDEI